MIKNYGKKISANKYSEIQKMRLKQVLSLIWNEFVYGGHLLSLGGTSIAYTSAILLNIKITWDFLLIVYLGFQSAYLYNRYKEIEKDSLTNPERTQYLKNHIKKIPLIIFCFLLIFFLIQICFQRTNALIFSFFVILFGLLYSISLKRFTKKIIAFKDIFVSLCWASVVIFLALYYNYPLKLSLFILFIFVLLRWVVNTSIFDLKDLENDKKENLLTLAVVLGEKKLVTVLSLITIIAVLPVIVGFYLRIIPVISLILVFTIPYSFYYFKKVQDRKINTAFLYNVIIDSEFLLWSVFILISRFLYANI